MNGDVSILQVERDLDTLHGLGFQAVTVQAGYNMPFAYLSPEYLKERDSRALSDAVTRFQESEGITATGTMDDATRRALARVYGS